jgi:anti-sigma factor RsiW
MTAECSEIALMLGAFEDGELEPHEYQSVALHLARCDRCSAELADYSTLGRELRSAVAQPQLIGFSAGVMRRIESLPIPVRTRIARFFDRLSEQIGAGFGMAAAAAAAAVVTIVLASPYAQNLARKSTALPQMAERQVARVENSAERAPAELASAPVAMASASAEFASASGDLSGAAQDSQAVISRLESEIPSVAVWSEPQTDTTVIWLPDQQQ